MRQNPFQPLPESVTVGNQRVPINTDFRVGIAIEQEILTDAPDILGLLNLFYNGTIPQPVEEAGQEMVRFYAHHDREEGQGKDGKAQKRAYDFSQDADALLSSFLDAYGIDLSTAKLHWWTFKRLLCNLPPETPFMRRLYYRTADTKKMSKSERKHVEKMRRLYSLKAPERAGKSAEELDKEFIEKARRRYAEAQETVKKG